ncbi:MAG: methyltransferase [Gammaproteobacteria bacterium]|nr:methyltransferase [Gammaproteobacteria bacterium]
MNTTGRFLILVFSIAGLLLATESALAEGWSADQLAAALDNEGRAQADKDRDAARKPADVIAFSGIESGMVVLDVMASAGYYTEVLSVAVGEDGTVYSQNPIRMLQFRDGATDKALSTRLADERLANVVRVDGSMSEIDVAAGSLDAAFTALNFHDTYYMAGEDVAAAWLQQIFEKLKPNGFLMLIDHAGDPDQDNAKLHRIPKRIAVDLATKAGFVVEADSDVLSHPEDDKTQMVFAREIRGKTDRFVLKLRKPG